MKIISIVLIAFAVATRTFGQIPVTDVANLANNQVAHAEDISKWVESIARLRDQIDALNREINIQSDIRKWTGNPVDAGAKMALTGLGGPELAQQYGQGKEAILGLVDSLGSLQRTAQGTFRAITNVDIDGNTFQRDPMIYRRYAVLDAMQDDSQRVADQTQQREQQLQSEIADTLEELKAADTDAEVQKLSATLTALNGQLAHVESARRREVDGVVLQKIANDTRTEEEERAEAELEERNAYLANQRITAYMKTLKVRQKDEQP
jgi:hypothetical protein